MRRHRGLFSGLVMGAVLGLAGNRSEAGPIILSVDLNGTVIYSVRSTLKDEFVSANVTALDHALTAAGSAYQFTGSLTATSNYTGSTLGAYLTTTGAINTSGSGTTAAILSVNTSQSGFLLPGPGPGYFISFALGNHSNAVGKTTFTGDWAGTNSLPLSFPSPIYGPPFYNIPQYTSGWSGGNLTPIPSLTSGFSLSSQFLFDIQKSSNFSESFPGTVEVFSIREPPSIVMFLTGMPLSLAIAVGLRLLTSNIKRFEY